MPRAISRRRSVRTAFLFLSLLAFSLPLSAYHLELEAQPAGVFPYFAKFGTIDLHVYDGGVRADTIWLDAFSRNGSTTITVLNPLARMYGDMPISQIPVIIDTLGTVGDVERAAVATLVSKARGKVKGLPAIRYRLVYGEAHI